MPTAGRRRVSTSPGTRSVVDRGNSTTGSVVAATCATATTWWPTACSSVSQATPRTCLCGPRSVMHAEVDGGGAMSDDTVNVRYMVSDVEQAIAFYTEVLGFEVLSNAAPAFADVQRGNLRLLLSGPA